MEHINKSAYYCKYCMIEFDDVENFLSHTTTIKHKNNEEQFQQDVPQDYKEADEQESDQPSAFDDTLDLGLLEKEIEALKLADKQEIGFGRDSQEDNVNFDQSKRFSYRRVHDQQEKRNGENRRYGEGSQFRPNQVKEGSRSQFHSQQVANESHRSKNIWYRSDMDYNMRYPTLSLHYGPKEPKPDFIRRYEINRYTFSREDLRFSNRRDFANNWGQSAESKSYYLPPHFRGKPRKSGEISGRRSPRALLGETKKYNFEYQNERSNSTRPGALNDDLLRFIESVINENIEPSSDDDRVMLDYYISDLYLQLKPDDYCSCKPISVAGFGYMWAGIKATHGACKGRVCYEVKIQRNNDVSHLEEPDNYGFRCGWSIATASLQLGDQSLSWGYDSREGMKVVNNEFSRYGIKYNMGDVIGSYLDMTGDPVTIGYAVNGIPQGVAFCISKEKLAGRPVFPHFLTKNQGFTVNFGQMDIPLEMSVPNFPFIGQLDTTRGLIRGPSAPKSRKDCQVLMMIGLPGAGKTTWMNNYTQENAESWYNILGTNILMDRMEVKDLLGVTNYQAQWKALYKKAVECFEMLMKICSGRKRNYIVDQTNVYPTARGRKLKHFQGMRCKAIVVVPTDEDLKFRRQKMLEENDKEIPEPAMLDMKANFVLPEFEELISEKFAEVCYVELSPSEALQVVQNYNAEAMREGFMQTLGVKSYILRNLEMRTNAEMFEPIGSMF